MMLLAGCGAPTQSPTLLPTPVFTVPQTAGVGKQPIGHPSACRPGDVSPLGVLRSTDHGVTWASLGDACIRDLRSMKPADPTGLLVDGRIVLYFTDLDLQMPNTLYGTTSADGVNFDTPKPTFTIQRPLYDPFVLRLSDGSFRAFIPRGPDGMISAKSNDAVNFAQESGLRLKSGDMPGAILLPDNRVRLFVQNGDQISSAISADGLDFTEESGVRLSAPPDFMVNNPQPIRLARGSYLMLFSRFDKRDAIRIGPMYPWKYTEIRLATSVDGWDWKVNPTVFGYGGTSCVVEAGDGTLLIYFGH